MPIPTFMTMCVVHKPVPETKDFYEAVFALAVLTVSSESRCASKCGKNTTIYIHPPLCHKINNAKAPEKCDRNMKILPGLTAASEATTKRFHVGNETTTQCELTVLARNNALTHSLT